MTGKSIRLNGELRSLSGRATVSSLLEAEGVNLAAKGTAVAVNAEVIPRSEWDERELGDGDVVDVIRAVQGG